MAAECDGTYVGLARDAFLPVAGRAVIRAGVKWETEGGHLGDREEGRSAAVAHGFGS